MITITKALPGDVTVVRAVGRETFFEAFAAQNTSADMQKYLDENFSEEKIQQELNNPESVFFIAREGEIPIGYMKLNTGTAQTDVKDELALEIERIYVKAAYQGKKVGQLLYEQALEVAKQRQKSYIWLGVWEENSKAINFYKKNGFVAFDKHMFKLGNDEQTDVMMKRVIE